MSLARNSSGPGTGRFHGRTRPKPALDALPRLPRLSGWICMCSACRRPEDSLSYQFTTTWRPPPVSYHYLQPQFARPEDSISYQFTTTERPLRGATTSRPMIRPYSWIRSTYTTLLSSAAEQCSTRVQHATRRDGLLEAWFWRRCAILKRRGTYRLITCLGIRLLPLHPGVHGPSSRSRTTSMLVSSAISRSKPTCKPPAARSTSSSTQDRPRPKSGGKGLGRLTYLMLMLVHNAGVLPSAGARVATTSTGVAGVPSKGARHVALTGTKQGGEHFTTRPFYTNVQKRAYRRAIRRAELHGHTSYRGRVYTIQSSASTKTHHCSCLTTHADAGHRKFPRLDSP